MKFLGPIVLEIVKAVAIAAATHAAQKLIDQRAGKGNGGSSEG